MRYARARYNQLQREEAYHFYISEALRMIANNTAQAEERMYTTLNLEDFIKISLSGKPLKKEKTTEEIIAEINRDAGLTMTGKESGNEPI